MPKPYNAPMLDTVANILGILTAAIVVVRFMWKRYGEKLEDWYDEVYCLLFNPGKKGPDAKATIMVEAVGVSRTRHDPYSGESFTIRSYNVDTPPMPDADEQRQLIFRLPPE